MKTLKLGDTQDAEYVEDSERCSYTTTHGAVGITYSIETTNGFGKMGFVLDKDSVLMIDVHK